MKKIILIALVAPLCLLSACQKKESEPKTSQLKIDIMSPKAQSEYHYGDTVFIKAHISNDQEMHGYSVLLNSKLDAKELMSYEAHAHGSTFHIDTFWVNNLNNAQELMLTFTTVVDHNGTKKTNNVSFQTINTK